MMQAPNLQDIQPFKLAQTTRLLLLAGGAVSILGALAINYWAGDALWVRLALSVAAGLVGFAIFNPGIDKESVVRVIFATFFASFVFMANPTPYLAKLAERAGLYSGDKDRRVEAFESLSERGFIEYSGVDLSETNLAERQFYFARFDNASLEGADLTKAQFFNTSVDGTKFTGAKLNGASFQQTSVDNAVGFDQAICDDETRLPEGWFCDGSSPKREGDG